MASHAVGGIATLPAAPVDPAAPSAAYSPVPIETRVSDGPGDGDASLARTLIDRSSAATSPADLTTLYLLQIAAGRSDDAKRTIERLQRFYRPERPQRANALAPWQIYVQARCNETCV